MPPPGSTGAKATAGTHLVGRDQKASKRRVPALEEGQQSLLGMQRWAVRHGAIARPQEAKIVPIPVANRVALNIPDPPDQLVPSVMWLGPPWGRSLQRGGKGATRTRMARVGMGGRWSRSAS